MRHYSPYLLPDAPSFVTRVPRFEFIFFIVSLGKRGVRRAVNLLKRSDGCLVCKWWVKHRNSRLSIKDWFSHPSPFGVMECKKHMNSIIAAMSKAHYSFDPWNFILKITDLRRNGIIFRGENVRNIFCFAYWASVSNPICLQIPVKAWAALWKALMEKINKHVVHIKV